MIQVIKIGGKLIENDTILSCLCDELTACYPSCILIHGGGSMAGQLSSRLGIGIHMIEGRRVTDGETLGVAVMVYAGWANKRIVAALQARKINACGLSGCDMGIVRAHKREVEGIDWGYVGDIDEVNTDILIELLKRKVIPVISPITFDAQGLLLNTNADRVAGAVATALGSQEDTELIFCFDKPGVLLDMEDENSVISCLQEGKYREYIGQGKIHSGMIPKLENAFNALKKGVKRVRITDMWHLKQGTVIISDK